MSLGCVDNSYMSRRLAVNDVLYGNISFSPLVKSIVDTEQFQRLRDIKQLGVTNFVYPSAVHSRFEHSIGTAYLCRKFLQTLQERLNQSPLGLELKRRIAGEIITNKDIVCVELAGLLHDIGHGPFSHMFEKVDNTNTTWTHEEMSCRMIDYLVENNPQVQLQLQLAGLNGSDLQLVKQLILGATPHNCPKIPQPPTPHPCGKIDQCYSSLSNQESSSNLLYVTALSSVVGVEPTTQNDETEEVSLLSESGLIDEDNIIPYCSLRDDPNFKIRKWFLFQIVSNKFTGIDCDKFDYMMRDCHYVGFKCNFDYTRYFQNCQLLQTTLDGIHISPRDKEFLNVNELFYSRWRLHRKVYQHKTVRPVELMVVEALREANSYFNINGALNDPALFVKLTDHIFYQILYSSDPLLSRSKHILTSVANRKILKLCGQVTLDQTTNLGTQSSNALKTKVLHEILSYDTGNSLNSDLLHVEIIDISCGMNVPNPINSIVFHTKNGQYAKLRPQCVSSMIPQQFSDKILRVYFGLLHDGFDSVSMESLFVNAVNCFQSWCSTNSLPLPHAISMKDPYGYFTHCNSNKHQPLKRDHQDENFHDAKITKQLQFNDP